MSLGLKTETVEIDGISFETTQFAGMRSLELMGELVATIGPAIAVFASSDDMSLEGMAPAIASAVRGLKEGELGRLALKVLAGTSATIHTNGTLRRIGITSPEAFDAVFSGRLKTMFKVIAHALKVNYSDFGVGDVLPGVPVQPLTETVQK